MVHQILYIKLIAYIHRVISHLFGLNQYIQPEGTHRCPDLRYRCLSRDGIHRRGKGNREVGSNDPWFWMDFGKK